MSASVKFLHFPQIRLLQFPIPRIEFAYPINHGFFHETFSEMAFFMGFWNVIIESYYIYILTCIFLSFAEKYFMQNAKRFSRGILDKKEYGEEKKCKAKQLFSSFMKREENSFTWCTLCWLFQKKRWKRGLLQYLKY